MDSSHRKERAEARTRRLGEANLRRVMFTLSVPAILGMLSNALYHVVDSIYIGRLGTQAIGAISVAFPIFALIGAVGISFGVGTASFISRALGAGRKREADRASAAGFVSVVVVGLSLSAFGLVFLDPVLRVFGATDTILPFARDYGVIMIAGSTVTMLKIYFNNLVRAEGNTRWSMIGMMSGAFLNIILDPILIFSVGLGIRGAAIATVISQGVALVLLAGHFVIRHSYVRFRPWDFRVPATVYRDMLGTGSPMFFRQAMGSFAIALLNNAAAAYGDPAVASVGIVLRVLVFGMMPVYGFGQGYQPVAGYNYGAGSFGRLFHAMRLSIVWTAIYTSALTAVALVFTPYIAGLFSTDSEVIAIGTFGLRMVYSVFPLFGFQVVALVSFQALGKPLPALFIGLARQGIFLVPAVFLLDSWFGLAGVLASQGVADLLTALCSIALGAGLVRTLRGEARVAAAGEPTGDAVVQPVGLAE